MTDQLTDAIEIGALEAAHAEAVEQAIATLKPLGLRALGPEHVIVDSVDFLDEGVSGVLTPGMFHPQGRSCIQLGDGADAVTVVHELAHWIDHQLARASNPLMPTFASMYADEGLPGPLDGWLEAVKSTRRYQHLERTSRSAQSLLKVMSDHTTGTGAQMALVHAEASYLLRPTELWAHSATQWMLDRSDAGQPLLQALQTQPGQTWEIDDFAPVHEAIETLLA